MKRLLILASKLGYQTRSFAEAARSLDVEVVFATDRCHQLDDPWADGAIAVQFAHPEEAAQQIIHYSKTRAKKMDGVIALGDQPIATAAHSARGLGIAYNPVEAVENCGTKIRQREVLAAAGLPVPEFFSFRLSEPIETVLSRVLYPCVIKPLTLSASQGVIRANDSREFRAAVGRIRSLLNSPDIQVAHKADLDRLIVEKYVPGVEVAVEGLLTNGQLKIRIFDKPDPLDGPYFEETIYVTPSRLPHDVQMMKECAQDTIHALGLTDGPLHAEFRVDGKCPWILEAAPRPIGGLCSRSLRFGEQRTLLEELLVRHALNLPGSDLKREPEASGVMMIPVPKSGTFEGLQGEEDARATSGVEDLRITARLHDSITAWPEGSSYLGFIFARGESPEMVEASLRLAHSKLRFDIVPGLPVRHPLTGKLPNAGIVRE